MKVKKQQHTNTPTQDELKPKPDACPTDARHKPGAHLVLSHPEVERCEEEREQREVTAVDVLTTHVAHVLTHYAQQVCDALLQVKDIDFTGQIHQKKVTCHSNHDLTSLSYGFLSHSLLFFFFITIQCA